MIHSVHFQNFKALRHVDIELEQFTVIVGPNSSGKSSILEGLHILTQLGACAPEKLLRGERKPAVLCSRGLGNGIMEVSCRGDEGALRLCVTVTTRAVAELRPGPDGSPRQDFSLHVDGLTASRNGQDWKPIKELPTVAHVMGSAVFLHLNARRLSKPSLSRHPRPSVEYDGENLASALAYLALNRPDDFQQLVACLRSVVPAVQRIRFDRVPLTRGAKELVANGVNRSARSARREYLADALIFDMEGAPDIPAHKISEGTILVLGILTILMGAHRPKLVLLDDLEQGLHPMAQRNLVALLRKILALNPAMQILATTHSPYLLDELRPEEVRLTTTHDDGSVVCGRLMDHPRFAKWKEEMSPGEFWSMVGEKWLAEGHTTETR